MTDVIQLILSNQTVSLFLFLGIMMIFLASSNLKIQFTESMAFQPRFLVIFGIFFLLVGILGLLTGGNLSFTVESEASSPFVTIVVLLLLGLAIVIFVFKDNSRSRLPPLDKTNLRENIMLDPNTIPVLMKALDFLFGEGSKILDERRQRRAKEQEKPAVAPKNKKKNNPDNTIQSKENALHQKIKESTWKNSENAVVSLLDTLEIYTQRYYLARKQYAIAGEATVDYKILHNLKESEDGVENTMQELQKLLSQIFGKQVLIDR